MELFAYARADEPGAAVRQVADDPRAAFLAGGTNVIDYMKLNVQVPDRLVDINHLGLDKIEVTDTAVRVGALVRNSDLAWHDAIRRRYPVLSEALLSGATPQLRNMATTGGNLLQRTRCPYYRDTAWACNKRQPGSGCSALQGYNRSHALLGTSEKCIATHPSDMCAALAALEAVIHTRGPKGERAIPFGEFYVAYGDDPAKENVLEHGELITAVEWPHRDWLRRSHYLKVRDRASFEFALASVAAALEVRDGKITQARVALGGVATKPWRAAEAEQ
ncbi:MAG: xanthine dehydrogenase family protein subunit M, partial [Zavarzinella sp.]|nr:xanthine dehydrogenase family protein subunit M [Zavarzinella sp.]